MDEEDHYASARERQRKELEKDDPGSSTKVVADKQWLDWVMLEREVNHLLSCSEHGSPEAMLKFLTEDVDHMIAAVLYLLAMKRGNDITTEIIEAVLTGNVEPTMHIDLKGKNNGS